MYNSLFRKCLITSNQQLNRKTLLNFKKSFGMKFFLAILFFLPLRFYSQVGQTNFYAIDSKVESISVAKADELAKQLASLGKTDR